MVRALCLLLLLAASAGARAQPAFNEVQGSNLETLLDEDGDSSDWIELYNLGSEDLDLEGHGLSDREAQPFRWTFPACTLPADSTLLVFASGKDRDFWLPHWETVIDHHDSVRYRPGDTEPPADWRQIGFDDGGWSEGPTGIGYGDNDDDTYVSPWIKTWYLRKSFSVEDLDDVGAVAFHIDYDDGYVAYLNGVEIARGHMGDPGPPPPHDSFAESPREATIFLGGRPEAKFFHDGSLLVEGENVLAVQVHNIDATSMDLSLIPFLTLGMREAPAEPRGLSAELFSQVPALHAGFELSPGSESLFLTAPDGAPLDQVNLAETALDHSFGRHPDGDGPWLVHEQPTPWLPNGEGGWAGYALPPLVTPAGGLYSGSVLVAMENQTPGGEIRWTLDASEPGESSSLYVGPLQFTETAVLRARCFAPGKAPSAIATQSYLFDETSALPLISLVTDPPNLWDEEIGIYVLGNDYYPGFPYYGANFWQDWERPVHMEYFPPGGGEGFALDLGMKIHGGMTRAYAQKSLRLLARQGYGASHIDYPLFPEKDLHEFKRILLRNSGNDWCRTMLRDGLVHRAMAGAELDRMAFEPAIVFLNGEYWGIHNVRERIDKHYLEGNHGVEPDEVDLLEFRWTVVEGDSLHYRSLLEYIEEHGVVDPLHYAYVAERMDLEEYAEYWISEVFFGNTDWPAGNIKFWRPRAADGSWRWLLFDTDFGLGLWEDYSFDTLAWSLAENGSGQNVPWSTWLMRRLLENGEFRRRFINRYADHLNTRFRPDRLGALADSLRGLIQPEIARHQERWGFSYGSWLADMAVLEEFVQLRPAVARGHLRQQFGLLRDWTLYLDVDPPGSGRVALEAVETQGPFSGDYFLGVPVELSALPAPGFAFDGWSDPGLEDDTALIYALGDSSLTARFREDAGQRVVIHEINYNAPEESDPGDWVELHNYGSQAVDLSGWTFKDGDDEHAFVLPAGAEIAGGGFLLLCEELEDFLALFPEVGNAWGDLGFGFSGDGEALRLFDPGGALLDRVEYDDAPPWPPEADGQGPTLELLRPDSDNALPENWAASEPPLGTPGAPNSVATGAGGTEPPRALRLEEPWPNPFNPVVHLRFGLPRAARVRLDVFDLRGARVHHREWGRLEAGWHERQWRAEGLASGLYFARLGADGQWRSRKLLLLK